MNQETRTRDPTPRSWTPSGADNQGAEPEPTREEKLTQTRRILADNVRRSAHLRQAVWDRRNGRAPHPAAQREFIVLAELRAYTIRRDALSIRYETDYAARTTRHAEERDALEAGSGSVGYGSDGMYCPWKPEWMCCPHMQDEEEEKQAGLTKSDERDATKTSKTGASKLRARIASSIKRRVQGGLRRSGFIRPGCPSPPPEYGLCLECRHRLLRVRQEAELENLYAAYCGQTYQAYCETAARVGYQHLAWWLPARKPVRPGPGTSVTMTPGGPVMISTRALNAPRRNTGTVGFACHNSDGSGDGGDGGDIQGALRYIQQH
ncbi:hypothetical protein F4775DRAFT_603425 [Biscogniauxia sp. FL1348]|nr:hypothetical protein F4775DRAFT_603425 [Biscogniauxia sp. FL1348]